MSLAPKPPLSVSLAANIPKCEARIGKLLARLEAIEVERRALAPAAAEGAAEAIAGRAALSAEAAKVRDELEAQTDAIAQWQREATKARHEETSARLKHLAKKAVTAIADRNPILINIERAGRSLYENVAALEAQTSSLYNSWQRDWGHGGSALLYSSQTRDMVGHFLYTLQAEFGALPEAKYTQRQWPGLRRVYQDASDWAKRVLIDGEDPMPAVAVAEAIPAPLPAPSAPPPEEPIEAMSGREWQALQDKAKRGSTRIADGVDNLDPHTGDIIDVSKI